MSTTPHFLAVTRVPLVNGRPLALVLGLAHLVPLVLANGETLQTPMSLNSGLTLRPSPVLTILLNHALSLFPRVLCLITLQKP